MRGEKGRCEKPAAEETIPGAALAANHHRNTMIIDYIHNDDDFMNDASIMMVANRHRAACVQEGE